MPLLVLEAAEVLKIGVSPDKLLAHTKCVKICDLFFGKCGETVLYFVIPDICREREREREAMVEVLILIAYSLSFQPDSQGQWKPLVCHP